MRNLNLNNVFSSPDNVYNNAMKIQESSIVKPISLKNKKSSETTFGGF